MFLLPDYTFTDSLPRYEIASAELVERTHGHGFAWFGRAASALYYAYRVAKSRHVLAQAEVIMPSVMCTTAAHTALLTDCTPRFADVDPHTALVTLDSIKARYTINTVAVVVIHLLGNMVDVAPIAEWCKQKNILLIEDLAQALGAVLPDGKPAGSYGDLVVYSFNKTKLIEVGGGALVANSARIAERLNNILVQYPPESYSMYDIPSLGLAYRNLHHSLVTLLRINRSTPDQIATVYNTAREVHPMEQALYIRPMNPNINFDETWQALPARLEARQHKAEQYYDALFRHSAWKLLAGWQTSQVCWRFSLLVNQPEQAMTFSESVRKDGFHVSNLYWAVNQLMRPSDTCPNADYVSRRIVNFWVDDSVDSAWITRCCESILHHADLLTVDAV
jgi:dTDP-4-amino-4,6-dideoxygalactose transaminase